jgi:hypothetical protein
MTRHARMALRRKYFIRKAWTRNQTVHETPNDEGIGKDFGKARNVDNDIRNRGLSQQLRGKTGIKDPRTRQQLRLGNERTTIMIY